MINYSIISIFGCLSTNVNINGHGTRMVTYPPSRKGLWWVPWSSGSLFNI